MRRAGGRASVVVAAVLAAVACGCGSSGNPAGGVSSGGDATPVPQPNGSATAEDRDGSDSAPRAGESTPSDDRAVTVRTTACGDASRTTGTGVIVGRALVLTAAHVVIGAGEVYVGGADEPSPVVLLDRSRDLALLKVPTVDATPVELADAGAGDEVRVVGGSASGTVAGRIERLLRMGVDDVRSTSRSVRSGFELDVAIGGGDSGAGVFDADDRLVGIVFAVPSDGSGATFAVDATEIRAVLDAPPTGEHRCDAARSQLVTPD